MQMTRRETRGDSRTTKPLLGGMVLLVLEVVIPVALANLIEALTIAGYLPETALLDLPLYAWALAACAVWILVVLNCGPFLALGRREGERRE